PDLSYELKKLDSNDQLLKLRLSESKIYAALSNIQKSRTALTAARSLSNSIFTSQLLQADLDMQTGLLNALEHRDYKTAHSYLSEAFESYDLLSDQKSIVCLKYLLTFYIMKNKGAEYDKAMNERLQLKYGSNPTIIALKQVAVAADKGSLSMFYAALNKYQDILVEDSGINTHLAYLCDEITEKNIIKIVKPYSHVQVDHIANKIELPISQVERILSTMILDRQICGVIDQHNGTLIMKQSSKPNKSYSLAINAIEELEKLVEVMDDRLNTSFSTA
ncbi:MAG: 26S proteasome non-ATPase regulatory subunit 11, partial [Paramarteilia canceri]